MAEIIGITLLVQIAMIVVFATLFNFAARLLKQPSLLAYIVAGLVIGPLGLGALNISFQGISLGIQSLEDVLILSELGIAFLLFSVGIESDFSKLKKVASVAIAGTVIQVSLIVAVVFGVSMYFNLLPFKEAIYLGVILAFSSTMVVVKLLSDSFQIDSIHGNLMIALLIVQDILVIIALPFLENLDSVFKLGFYSEFLLRGLLLVIIAFVLSMYVFPKLFSFAVKSTELLFLTALSSCFLFIFLSITILKMPMAIGAFVAGLSLSTLPYNMDIYDAIRGVRDFFVTIFFVALGMQVSFAFDHAVVLLVVVALAVTYILKPVLFYFISFFSGHSSKTAFIVGIGLAQVSEFSFIIANQGLTAGLISRELFSVAILVIAFSMVLTPYLFAFERQLYNLFGTITSMIPVLKTRIFFRREDELEESKEMSDHVIIAGAGTMGATIADELEKLNVKTLLVDRNARRAAHLTKKGHNVIYGLAKNPLVWHKLNISKAKLLVITNPDVHSSIKLIQHAREVNPGINVFARAHYFDQAEQYYNAEVDYVCMPHVIGSYELLKAIGEFLNDEKTGRVHSVKKQFFEYMQKKSQEEKELKGLDVKRTDLIE